MQNPKSSQDFFLTQLKARREKLSMELEILDNVIRDLSVFPRKRKIRRRSSCSKLHKYGQKKILGKVSDIKFREKDNSGQIRSQKHLPYNQKNVISDIIDLDIEKSNEEEKNKGELKIEEFFKPKDIFDLFLENDENSNVSLEKTKKINDKTTFNILDNLLFPKKNHSNTYKITDFF